MTDPRLLGGKRQRQEGAALVVVAILGVGLLMLTAVSVNTTHALGVFVSTQEEDLQVRQIAESGAAQALARIKSGGFNDPVSGPAANASWVPFGAGEMFYYTDFDGPNNVTIVRAWGRIAVSESPSGSSVAPDDAAWNGDGYVLAGVEISILGTRYIPTAPFYSGNGGIQMPLGGFDWNTPGIDPLDRSTWVPSLTQDSYQAGWVPFETSALDHAPDYLYNPVPPAPATTSPHPYKPWVSQGGIGQFNAEAWFANSAGAGNPLSQVTPDVASYYDSNASSPDYAFPVDPDIQDVQDFAWSLWSKHNAQPGTNLLTGGTHSGVYGTYASPAVTFVTGELNIPAGQTFSGAGILVIRDDYDPNVDLNNMPTAAAMLTVSGTLEWTGLVIVSGWNAMISVNPGGDATVVGSLFCEDSVQSLGEVSLDSATVILRIEDRLRLLYSNALFELGGLVHDYLPTVEKKIVGARDL